MLPDVGAQLSFIGMEELMQGLVQGRNVYMSLSIQLIVSTL